MTNEVAAKRILSMIERGENNVHDPLFDDLTTLEINALKRAYCALERDRWISVEDRLPEKDGEYLFYGDQYFVPDHNGDPDNYKRIKSGYWIVNQSLPDYIGNMIFTHWMPLPEPPKEET